MKDIVKCKKWRILAYVSVLGMLFACVDQLRDDVNPAAEQTKDSKLTVSAAKQWFESNYTPVVATRSVDGGERLQKPYWEKAKEYNRKRYEVVETPILAKGIHIVMDNETAEHWESGKKSDFIRNTIRMVVLRDKKKGTTRSFIMTFVGTLDYLKKTRTIGKNSYLYREPDFSGAVLFHELDGTFLNGWRYSDGKIVATLSKMRNDEQAVDASGAETRAMVEVCRDRCYPVFEDYCDYSYVETGDLESGIVLDIVEDCGIRYVGDECTQDCYEEDDGSDDYDDDEDNWWENDYPPGGATPPPSTGNPPSNNTPKAKKIFRNSNMTQANWAALERMLNKIMANCMGAALYNGLEALLGGKTLTIQFNAGTDGLFSGNGSTGGISLGMQMESNQLFHEMMHAYKAYQETPSSYNASNMNGEIEAHYAQYLYTSSLPEYPGSEWEDRDNNDPRRSVIKDIAKFIDNKGNLRAGVNRSSFEDNILNGVVPTFHQNGYPANDFPFDYDRPGLENFANLRTLTVNCP
ncbi:hypothetical protein [Bacteroides sp. UBA939]|uniref:hypothetical protein n=1 Tax=Bacteroides sp. UBA939 TaxID=1946092 RepID=UPI0025B9CA9A|nr:hypothetical protein [Bacteroides sp. UBA939]